MKHLVRRVLWWIVLLKTYVCAFESSAAIHNLLLCLLSSPFTKNGRRTDGSRNNKTVFYRFVPSISFHRVYQILILTCFHANMSAIFGCFKDGYDENNYLDEGDYEKDMCLSVISALCTVRIERRTSKNIHKLSIIFIYPSCSYLFNFKTTNHFNYLSVSVKERI